MIDVMFVVYMIFFFVFGAKWIVTSWLIMADVRYNQVLGSYSPWTSWVILAELNRTLK